MEGKCHYVRFTDSTISLFLRLSSRNMLRRIPQDNSDEDKDMSDPQVKMITISAYLYIYMYIDMIIWSLVLPGKNVINFCVCFFAMFS